MQARDVTATPDAALTADGRRLASLDGLRAVAALAVFAFHGWLYTKPVPSAAARSSLADYALHEMRLGVVLFFVLSGFLLARPWIAAALDERPAPDLRRYARSRAARIAPAYYLALCGSIVALWTLSGTPGLRLPPARELPLFFVFAQNLSQSSVMTLDPPMWSLAVEVSFYALLPLLGWLAVRLPPRRRVQALVPLCLIAAGVAYNWAIAGQGLGLTFSKTLAAMLPYFGLGMLAALALHRRTIAVRTTRLQAAAGLALVLADALAKAAAPASGLDATIAFSILRDLPSAIGFALIIAALAAAPRGGILTGRVLVGMGTISYGFYLWHVPVLMFLRGHGLLPLDFLLGTAVAFVPTLAISALSWHAIERPIIVRAARRNERARGEQRSERERALGRASGGGADVRAGRREVAAFRA